MQELKPVLKEELEKKANDAIKKIEDLKNVPESEKKEKIEAIQKELETGKKAIDDAKTLEDATDAKDTSARNIDKINKTLIRSINEMDKIDKNLMKPQPVLPAAGNTASSIRSYGLLLSLVGMLIFVIQTKKNR